MLAPLGNERLTGSLLRYWMTSKTDTYIMNRLTKDVIPPGCPIVRLCKYLMAL